MKRFSSITTATPPQKNPSPFILSCSTLYSFNSLSFLPFLFLRCHSAALQLTKALGQLGAFIPPCQSPYIVSDTHTRTPPFSLLCTRVFFRTTHTHSDDRKSSQPSVSAVSRLLFWKRYLRYSRSILFYFYSLSLVKNQLYRDIRKSWESKLCSSYLQLHPWICY